MKPKLVAYIEHSTALGGSCVSLYDLIRHIPSTYKRIVLTLNTAHEVIDFYQKRGIQTEEITAHMFRHTTGGWWPVYSLLGVIALISWVVQFPFVTKNLKHKLLAIKPDLVHLNSLTLAPYAPMIKSLGIPVILHVREAVHPGHIGIRKRWLKSLASKWCDQVIYICIDNQSRLTGFEVGIVVNESVDIDRFDVNIDQKMSRQKLGIRDDQQVVLFLGGLGEIKGGLPFLEALLELKKEIPNLIAIVAGHSFSGTQNPLLRFGRWVGNMFGWHSYAQQVRQFYADNQLETFVRLMPFRNDTPFLLAAADVLAFPAMAPHFSRPAIEAAAMAKPVVASAVGGVMDAVEDRVTGLLVPPGDEQALSQALKQILSDPNLGNSLGQAGYRHIKKNFDSKTNALRVFCMYRSVLGGTKHG